MVVGRNYDVQSTTNLASGIWTTETNFTAGAASLSISNAISNQFQTFYRVAGY